MIESSCCGMAGAFGYAADTFKTSMAMAELSLLPAVRKVPSDTILAADGFSCRHQDQGRIGSRRAACSQGPTRRNVGGRGTMSGTIHRDDAATSVGPATDAIPRVSLHDQLLGRLRSLIVEGELPPGAKIDEKELGGRFGVSRTPLREALKVLASEGLVTLKPHRGAVVSELDLDELAAAFPVMGALEALAGELAVKERQRCGYREDRPSSAATRGHAPGGKSSRLLRSKQNDP